MSEDDRKIFKAINNGLEWVEQSSGSTDFLNAIFIIYGNHD